MDDLPTVAIVGRPNVGKSTLFNRLTGKKLALVDDRPGVTRDRREGEGSLGGLPFRLVDTAGLEDADDGSLTDRMKQQTKIAIAEADVVLFLMDAREGVTISDRDVAALLRRDSGKTIVICNKCEGRTGVTGVAEAHGLGLGQPIPISAEHGEGLGDLYDALVEKLGHPQFPDPELEESEEPDEEGAPNAPMRLAVVGRPNVGKSTLINRLLGQERMLTGPEAGITRDAISVPFTWRGQKFRLCDTAGMRRRARIDEKLEKMSVTDSLRAIRYAEVVILTLDGNEGLDKQDLAIADHVIEEGRALVLAVNKWDIVPDRDKALLAITDRLQHSLAQVKGLPVVTVSAKDGRNLDKLMTTVLEQHKRWDKRVSTGEVNRFLEGAIEANPPPLVAGRAIRIRYGTQVKGRPPTFALFVSKPEELPDSYTRYLVNGIRERFGMGGVPIRIVLRKRKNPYADAG
jgi:GTP-binding protein